MEILNVRAARSIWLFESRDMNPRGLNLLPLVAAVKEKYQFLKWPSTPEDFSSDNSKSSEFRTGAFAVGDRVVTVDFTLFSDGIVAQTASSTKDTDAFIEDLFLFGMQYGMMCSAEIIQRKRYASELIVRPKGRMATAYENIGKIAARLNELVIPAEATYEWTGFEISPDPSRLANQPVGFRFERESKVAFDLNRFYSIAPLQTEQHVELLAEMESSMMDG